MPTLTLRKVIKFGELAYVVTLPTAWVRYHRLQAGDKLEVIADGKLTIRPIKTRSK